MRFLNDSVFMTPTLSDSPGDRGAHRAGRDADAHRQRAEPRARRRCCVDQRLNLLLDGAATAKNPSRRLHARPRCWTICSAASGRSCGRAAPKIDPYRRTLQNNYLTQMNAKLNPNPAQAAQIAQLQALGITITPLAEDARSEIRGEVVALRERVRAAQARAADRRRGCISPASITGSGRFWTRRDSRLWRAGARGARQTAPPQRTSRPSPTVAPARGSAGRPGLEREPRQCCRAVSAALHWSRGRPRAAGACSPSRGLRTRDYVRGVTSGAR